MEPGITTRGELRGIALTRWRMYMRDIGVIIIALAILIFSRIPQEWALKH